MDWLSFDITEVIRDHKAFYLLVARVKEFFQPIAQKHVVAVSFSEKKSLQVAFFLALELPVDVGEHPFQIARIYRGKQKRSTRL